MLSLKDKTLSKALSGIRLDSDTSNVLETLECFIQVEIDPTSSSVSYAVKARDTGKFFCTLEQLEKLFDYRSFMKQMSKTADKSAARDELARFLAAFIDSIDESGGIAMPESMNSDIKPVILDHRKKFLCIQENLESLKSYKDKEDDLHKYLHTNMMLCSDFVTEQICATLVTNVVPDKEDQEKAFSQLKIPKWIWSKCSNDKNFVRKDDSATVASLLFPAGNFMNNICMTTSELQGDAFWVKNEPVMRNSTMYRGLLESDLILELTEEERESELDRADEIVKDAYDGFTWPMLNPSVEKVFASREKGKGAPAFKFAKEKSGLRKKQAATEAAKLLRAFRGKIEKFRYELMCVLNFVVVVDNNVEQFWNKLFRNSTQWTINPKRNIFTNIREENNYLEIMNKLLVLDSSVNAEVLNLVLHKLGIYDSYLRQNIETEFKKVECCTFPSGTGVKPETPVSPTLIKKMKVVTRQSIKDARKYFGLEAKSKMKKKTSKTHVLLSKASKEYLRSLTWMDEENPGLTDSVRKWLGGFNSMNSHEKLQQLAVSFISTSIEDEGYVSSDDDAEEENQSSEADE